jgi:predicted glutamine amidotransferase
MCRLFGFRSNLPAPVHRSLLAEKNSLRVQSTEHKDGWGIAYYDKAIPDVAHGLGPAHSDPDFERVSNLLSSRAVLAHVRLASVGAVHLRNAHPFLHEEWSFAHNGTIREFVKHQSEVEALIDPAFLPKLKGETDSERCFFLFLTHLKAIAGDERPNIEQVARALARTMRRLVTISDRPGPEGSSMNFLATDGRLMVACRRNRTLFFSEWKKKATVPHVEPTSGTRIDQLVIASEKLSAEDHWHEIPEEGIVGVDADLVFHRWMIAELG